MKRTIAVIAVLLLLVTLAAGCASGAAKDVDLAMLDAALAEKSPFIEVLESVDSELGCMIFMLDPADCEEAYFRFSSGATAEETALIKAKDKDALDRIEKTVRDRLAFQKESFADYIPTEVPKIESAILRTSGNYLIYCVADDAAEAQAVIDSYVK